MDCNEFLMKDMKAEAGVTTEQLNEAANKAGNVFPAPDYIEMAKGSAAATKPTKKKKPAGIEDTPVTLTGTGDLTIENGDSATDDF